MKKIIKKINNALDSFADKFIELLIDNIDIFLEIIGFFDSIMWSLRKGKKQKLCSYTPETLSNSDGNEIR